MSLYNMDYEGVYTMLAMDGARPLLRWFYNYKLERFAFGPQPHEWLVIEEEHRFTPKGKKITYYTGIIASDGPEAPRKVRFEVGAPPPPFWNLPQTKTYGDFLKERAERWRAMEERRKLALATKPVPADAVPVPMVVPLDDSTVTKEIPLLRNV